MTIQFNPRGGNDPTGWRADVIQWALYDNPRGGATQSRCATLPYRIDEYAKALRGGAPSATLRGSITKSGKLSLLTPYGHPVSALIEGTYAVSVRDNSTKHSFHLAGTTLHRRSGVRFTGTRTWTIRLPSGYYTYASEGPRGPKRSLTVLTPG